MEPQIFVTSEQKVFQIFLGTPWRQQCPEQVQAFLSEGPAALNQICLLIWKTCVLLGFVKNCSVSKGQGKTVHVAEHKTKVTTAV